MRPNPLPEIPVGRPAILAPPATPVQAVARDTLNLAIGAKKTIIDLKAVQQQINAQQEFVRRAEKLLKDEVIAPILDAHPEILMAIHKQAHQEQIAQPRIIPLAMAPRPTATPMNWMI